MPAIIPSRNHWYASISHSAQIKEMPAHPSLAALEGGVVTAMVRSYLAKVRQSFALRCQPRTVHRQSAGGGSAGKSISREAVCSALVRFSPCLAQILLCSEQIGFSFLAEENRDAWPSFGSSSLIHACDTCRRSSSRPGAPSDCDDFLHPWSFRTRSISSREQCDQDWRRCGDGNFVQHCA